jgi:ankyrin repeat protein
VTLPYVLADAGMVHLLSREFQQRDPDLSATRERYGTLLGAAIGGSHTEVVKLMLERGANKNWTANEFGKLLKLAAGRRDPRVLELLIEAEDQLDYDEVLQALLIRHSQDGNNAIVKVLLDKGANVNAQGGEYGNALQAASAGGYKEIVQQLLDKGADVNAQGGEYGNALQAALARGYKEIVQQLQAFGA